MGQLGNFVIVGVLTVASGLMDARAFVYAGRTWPNGQLDVRMGLSSLAAFIAGITFYLVAVKFMQNAGIQSVALQTCIWFVVTVIGIAAMDGAVLTWTRPQQVVGIAVTLLLGWLIITTRSAAA
jgi:hypothetical protein